MKKGEKIWFNGKLVNWDEAQVHVLTHTLHYGLGVFEGIRCYLQDDGGSAVFRLKEHTNRLFASAHIAQMKIPFTKDEINLAVIETLKANKLKEGYIRPLAFLAEGSMGIFPKDNPVRVAIAAWEWGAYLGEDGLKKGIRAKVSSFTRHHVNVGMTKAKIVGNYVTSVLNGITRDAVINIARDQGITVNEGRFTRDELYIADEAFFTGTAAEITPIRELDDRMIGEGKPGPVTKKIQDTFFDIVKGRNNHYSNWLWRV